MTSRCILALDQGTTSSRAIVFDDSGTPLAVEKIALPQSYPQPGWVEHDPELIWQGQQEAARRAVRTAGLRPGDIAAVGLTNQRETTILWERRTGRPVADALVWQDRRTSALCAQWRENGWEEDAARRTGLRLDPYFSASKIRWLLDAIPGLRRRAERGEIAFGTVDAWLLWRMTGGRVHATDITNASRTLLFNLQTLDWDDELLLRFDIPRALLPEVHPSSGFVFGETEADFLGASLPIAGIAGDQHAAAFGQRCFGPGLAKNTYGTGCFLLMNTGPTPVPSRHGLLTTTACSLAARPPLFALEGSVFVAGAAVQWLRDELGFIRNVGEVEALAQSVPDTGGVTFVPAFVGLGAPYWDSDARGALLGLTRGTRPAHIARAVLEAVCFSTRDVLEAMRADSGLALSTLRVDGGMAVNDFLLQTQADMLGAPVVRPAVTETTALGAALLAGLTAGVWSSPESLPPEGATTTFLPRQPAAGRDARYAAWQAAVRRVGTLPSR